MTRSTDTTLYDVLCFGFSAVVVASCSTCAVVESCNRVEAYRDCVELHEPDECQGARP